MLEVFTQGAFGFGFLSILGVPESEKRNICWLSRLEGKCLELVVNSWKNESSSYQEIPAHLPSNYMDKMGWHNNLLVCHTQATYIDWIYVDRMDLPWICGTSLHVAHSCLFGISGDARHEYSDGWSSTAGCDGDGIDLPQCLQLKWWELIPFHDFDSICRMGMRRFLPFLEIFQGRHPAMESVCQEISSNRKHLLSFTVDQNTWVNLSSPLIEVYDFSSFGTCKSHYLVLWRNWKALKTFPQRPFSVMSQMMRWQGVAVF